MMGIGGFVPQFWPNRGSGSTRPWPARSMKQIITEVAHEHHLTYRDLVGPDRHRPVVRARHRAMYLCHKEGHWSLPQIGQALGQRDHTTVLYGLRQERARLEASQHRQPEGRG